MHTSRISVALLSMLVAAGLFAACERRTTTVTDQSQVVERAASTTRVGAAPAASHTTPAGSQATSATARTMSNAARSPGHAILCSDLDAAEGTVTGPPVAGDFVMTGKVKDALLANPDVKGLGIDVDTHREVVRVCGTVDTQARVDKVIQVVRGVQGVKAIDNRLSVKKP